MSLGVTTTVSQRLQQLFPIKIANDFHQYLKEEEYDSEVLTDDLKETQPFFVEYIMSQNPSTFNDQTQKQLLITNVRNILQTLVHDDDTMEHVYNAEPLDREYSMSPEEEKEASLNLIHQLITCDEQQQQQIDDQIKTDEKYAQTLVSNKSIDKEQKADKAPLVCDEKWDCIYNELQSNYNNMRQCNQYYSAVVDVLNKKEFEFDDAAEDLNGFSETHNDSIIAEGIMDKFGWKQNDVDTIQFISYLKQALSDYMNEDKLYEVHCDEYENNDMNECTEWKSRIATIIGLRRNAKYRKKLSKYEAFAKALTVFDDRELECLLRLWLRQKMVKTSQEFNEGRDILDFVKYRFPEKSQTFDDAQLKEIFKIGFDHKLIGHNSILRKLNEEYQVFIDLKTIQIWMIAIVMKMHQYLKYKSCHAVFCMRFLPQNEGNEQVILDTVSLDEKIQRAFTQLEESEKDMVNDDCWVFVIDFSASNHNNEPEIYFESRELYDDEVISERKYNSHFAKNQLYHLKRLDYLVSKENDNSAMALQISFHKYGANNCVSWLTHSSGHIPFFEADIVEFIPKIFKTRTEAITNDEWKAIVNNTKIAEIKSMDRKYSELEQCYNNFHKK